MIGADARNRLVMRSDLLVRPTTVAGGEPNQHG
jgi:hypothetical protein